MSYSYPEKPLLVYPSLACQLGVEPALLLGLYTEIAHYDGIPSSQGEPEILLAHSRWQALAPFWDENRLRELTEVLVKARRIDVQWGNGSLRIRLKLLDDAVNTGSQPQPQPQPQQAPEPEVSAEVEEPAEDIRHIPVVDAPPPRPRHEPQPQSRRDGNLVRQMGPAPTFGGSIGWRRNKDELQALFEQKEIQNQRLQPMQVGWQPSEMFYQLLPKYSIPKEFADGCIDEFVLYYLDKDRKENNWNQKFLAWVKREWVKKQTHEAREQRYQQERENRSGVNNENARPDSREKRKRVTAAIMDIKDTDW